MESSSNNSSSSSKSHPFSFMNTLYNNTNNSTSNNNNNSNRMDKLIELPNSSNNSPEFINNNGNNNSNINNISNNSNNNSNNNLSSPTTQSIYNEKIVAATLDRYENQIESLMDQIQVYIEKEQKLRSQCQSVEDANARLENENLQLKKELFELNRKFKETDMNNMNNNNINNNINNNVNSNNNSNNNNNNNNNNGFSPPPLIKYPSNGNLQQEAKRLKIMEQQQQIQQQQKQPNKRRNNNSNNKSIDGDEEAMVAEALGSFVDYASKPLLKRSNSEEVFNSSMYKNKINNNSRTLSEIQNWQQQLPQPIQNSKKRKDTEEQLQSTTTSTSSSSQPTIPNTATSSTSSPFDNSISSRVNSIFNANNNNSNLLRSISPQQISQLTSPQHAQQIAQQQQYLQQQQQLMQQQLQQQQQQQAAQQVQVQQQQQQQLQQKSNSNGSLKLSASSGSIKDLINTPTPTQPTTTTTTTTTPTTTPTTTLSKSLSIPEMETDVESTDEFDFNRMKDDDGSPDSNEMSRNGSSSPIDIETGYDGSNLFSKSATPGSASSPQEELLNEIHSLQMQQRETIEKMYSTQKQYLLDLKSNKRNGISTVTAANEEILSTLQSEQVKLGSTLESELQALNQLYSQTILEPNQLCKLDILLQDVSIQLKQLHLYQMELTNTNVGLSATATTEQFPATLVIIKQPFPMVISKFKQLQEDHLCVQLLTGSNVDIVSYSPIKAELVFHSKNLTKGSSNLGTQSSLKKNIEKDTQILDPIKGIAKFPIKFLTGTRKSCVKLHFILQIKTSDSHIINVPSSTSQPFIVITNDCQWEGSEGTLLKKETFNEKFEITWPHFVNILQKHFLKATKQSPIQPTRPLSMYDFTYLSSTFFAGKSTVSHKDFDQFWGWFGKSIQTLRYKRHISTLWQNGFIFMFLKRDIVNQILRNQEAGTFVILFSEAFPGQLEISYVGQSDQKDTLSKSSSSNLINNNNNNNTATTTTNDGTTTTTRVKHYLVQANDTSGSKRTLPDFLNECPQFTHILQLNVAMIPQTENIPIFKRELKNIVLEPYYSKRQNSQNILGSGYDPLF